MEKAVLWSHGVWNILITKTKRFHPARNRQSRLVLPDGDYTYFVSDQIEICYTIKENEMA